MKWQHILAQISLVCVFLVILAGSVVRMTGSGRGCPDWPKCFGYLVPPSDAETLTWRAGKDFCKGQMIIREQALWVAQSHFTTAKNYKSTNWKEYTQHDYAQFNGAHTWTEYINRLVGATTGIPVFLLFMVSLIYWRRDVITTVLSAAVLLMLGFEAWLGKLVVDGNLIPNQVTLHMMGAVVLVTLVVIIINRTSHNPGRWPLPAKHKVKNLRFVLGAGIAIGLMQIVLGTQVREEVDMINRGTTLMRGEWIEAISAVFEWHRSFAIVVLVVNGWVIYRLWRWKKAAPLAKALALILIFEVLAGLTLTYLGFPRGVQPVHLMLAMLMFAVQWSLVLRLPAKSATSTQSSAQNAANLR